MTDGLDTSPLDRMQARYRDVRSKLRAHMEERQTPWKIPCKECGNDRHLNLDESVMATMRAQDFLVRYYACSCWKKAPAKAASTGQRNRATHPDP